MPKLMGSLEKSIIDHFVEVVDKGRVADELHGVLKGLGDKAKTNNKGKTQRGA